VIDRDDYPRTPGHANTQSHCARAGQYTSSVLLVATVRAASILVATAAMEATRAQSQFSKQE